MWNVYKELKSVVENALREKSEMSVQKLDASFKLHRADFMDFLKNPAKNASDRAAVLAGVDKGLKTQRSSAVVFLTSEMINEALTLSELFDLNEVVAVDLLLTAESEQYFYPGLSRGLIAVLIYFQSKVNLAQSLQMVLQARDGRTWEVVGTTDQLNDLVHKFTNQLVDAGLVSKILNLLTIFNENNQLTRLQLPQFLAIGPPKHKFKTIELIRGLNNTLGSCLFYLSCQSGLSKADTLLLIGYLASIDQSESATSGLSNGHTAVLMSLLYSFDLKILEVQQDEDWTNKLPMLTDPSFHQEVTRLLSPPSSSSTSSSPASSSSSWTVPGLEGVVCLAWAVSLTHLSNYHDTADRADAFVDRAVEKNVFSFINTSILCNPCFFQEQYYVRRMHFLVTDFIVMMPLKVKEMRAVAEEEESMMEVVPAASQAMQQLLYMIGSLYKTDPLQLELSLELWCPNEAVDHQSVFNHSSKTSIITQRRVTLFKFIRLAGDMLTPPLYSAYISMLTGLSTNQMSAHCCFNLLKLNAMTTGSQSSIVSWEHFFSSLDNYYTSLKHDDAPATTTAAAATASHNALNQSLVSPFHQHQQQQQQQHYLSSPHRSQQLAASTNQFDHQAGGTHHLSPPFAHRRNVISEQDVDGLIAVLSLISTVLEKDPDARVALTEGNRGQSLFTIFGLITCSIPLTLKAALLRCLASFGRSCNVAADVWLMMEKAQLLYMVGRNGSITARGLHIEIDEMEPQTEEYSLTRSFVHLLCVLSTHPLTTTLSYGVTPFVNFMKDFIFLKASSKAYKRPSEKWEVTCLCLEVVHRLVDAYDVILAAPDDPASSSGVSSSSSSSLPDPRAQLLGLFYCENNFLKMILSIIDQTSKSLDKHIPPEERQWMDGASLWCLRLLHTALAKQAPFIEMARKNGTLGVGSTGVDKLLMAVNPRTLKSDHVINLSRFLVNSWNLPGHSLQVSHILSHLSTSTYALPKVVSMLSSNQTYLRELMAAVAECFDCEDAEVEQEEEQEDQYNDDTDNNPNNNNNMEVGRMRVETRRVLMQMLLSSMTSSSSRDMAYLLCGFDVLKPIYKTQLQDPGINHFPRTLLHSIINHFSTSQPPSHFLTISPSFSLMAYKLIYYLTSDPQAHSSTLRFLRSHDFLYKQVVAFPVDAGPDGAFLGHLSWLLRALVVDLKVSASSRQRSYVQKVLDLFVKPSGSTDSTTTDTTGGTNHFSSRIIGILRLINLNAPPPEGVPLSLLQPEVVERLVLACEVVKEKSLKVVDISLLYRHLVKQCSTLAANMASQKERAFKDIELLCANVADRNRQRRTLHACKGALVAVKQLLEVALTACPYDCLSEEDRQLFIVALLQTLLHKISTDKPAPELATPLSELILTLCCQLDRSFNLHSSLQPAIHPSSMHLSHDASILPTRTEGIQARNILSSPLQAILASILNYLLSSAPSHFRVRTYLYGAVWYCLNIAKKPSPLKHSLTESLDERMHRYLLDRDEPYEQLSRQTMATVANVAPQLLSVLCKDSCDGHDISKMLSMTVLDCMLASDSDHAWLDDTASKGFIHHLVASLLEDSRLLEGVFNKGDSSSSLRGLFIFQSKIALLSRISSTAHGGNLLLCHDLMSVLSQCYVLDAKLTICNVNRPPVQGQFVPSMLSTYRQQVLFPVLTLCLSLLTSLGPNNVMAVEKLFPFVMNHYELFVSILSDQHSPISVESLQELQLVSALVSKTALDVAVEGSLFMDAMQGEVKACANKLQRLMGALLGRFSLGEVRRGGLVRRVAIDSLASSAAATGGTGELSSDHRDASGKVASRLLVAETKVMILLEEILCNSLSLSHAIVAKNSVKNAAVSVLFAPSISDAIIQQNRTDNDYNLPSHSAPQSMGVLVQLLMDACGGFGRTLKQQQDTLHRHLHVAELSVEEVKEVLEDEEWTEKLPLPQRHSLLRHKLLLQLEDKSKELKLLRFIIENSLLLLWRHLDFYLVRCQSAEAPLVHSKLKYAPNDSSLNNTGILNGGDGTMVGGGVPRELLNVLKRDCIAWINEAFFKALLDVEAAEKRKDGFIGALVRKVKRMVTFNTVQK